MSPANVRYWFPPGTVAAISVKGGDFKPIETRELMIFDQPSAETADEFTFEGNGFYVRVAKAFTWRYEWDGTGGHNRLCG